MPPSKRKVASRSNGANASHVQAAQAAAAEASEAAAAAAEAADTRAADHWGRVLLEEANDFDSSLFTGASGDPGPSSAGAGCPGTSRDSSAEPGPQDACVWRPASPSPQPTALERRRAQAVLRQRRAEQTRRGRSVIMSVIRVRSDACDSCLRYLCLMCVLIRPCTMSVLHSHRARTHVTHYSGETERYKLVACTAALLKRSINHGRVE